VCLDYSPFLDQKEDYMLVSGSRDRLIHIYSGREEYKNVNTLEGHSSSILSVKYAFDPEETDEAKRLKLLSWGWDKTIIYRGVESATEINIYHKEVLKNNKFSAMEVRGSKVVAGLDKLVTVTNVGSHVKIYEK
jgi:WD40 repeat protein